MIDKAEAKKQVLRLSSLDFFPKEREAAADLVSAMQVAETAELAKAITDDWVANETQCPKASEIRRALYDRAEEIRGRRKGCNSCGGNGSVVQFYLVTYREQSFVIQSKKRLDISTEEEAQEFRRKLAERPGTVHQDVLSAAAPCPACRAKEAAA